jgi:uncharacterized protein (DUF58 family)
MQDLKEILAKLRKFEIRIRKAISSQQRGNYHSIFKGSGLEFSDVRDYNYGDDVRRIDWNVSAKGQGTFVKEFKEEKEQTVFFLLDVSASQNIGTQDVTKIQIGKEICGVLALSAVKENNEIGLICYSDQKEKYLKPQKGLKFSYELISSLFKLEPQSLKTSLSNLMNYALKTIKRKSMIILISDFLDENYQHNLTLLAQKHDLVVVHLYDNQEIKLPRLGIIPLYDKETQTTMWYDTTSKDFQFLLKERFENTQKDLESICKKLDTNYLLINTEDDFIPNLIKLFRVRNVRRK